MQPLTITYLVGAALLALATFADHYEVALPKGTPSGGPPSTTATAWPRWSTVMVLLVLALVSEVALCGELAATDDPLDLVPR